MCCDEQVSRSFFYLKFNQFQEYHLHGPRLKFWESTGKKWPLDIYSNVALCFSASPDLMNFPIPFLTLSMFIPPHPSITLNLYHSSSKWQNLGPKLPSVIAILGRISAHHSSRIAGNHACGLSSYGRNSHSVRRGKYTHTHTKTWRMLKQFSTIGHP